MLHPTLESNLLGTWCACLFYHEKKEFLYIGWIKQQFLIDATGPIDSMEVDCCLKVKAGTKDIYEHLPEHELPDISKFKAPNIVEKQKWKLLKEENRS